MYDIEVRFGMLMRYDVFGNHLVLLKWVFLIFNQLLLIHIKRGWSEK